MTSQLQNTFSPIITNCTYSNKYTEDCPFPFHNFRRGRGDVGLGGGGRVNNSFSNLFEFNSPEKDTARGTRKL